MKKMSKDKKQSNGNGKKRTARQMRLSVAMVIVSLIVLSISTYAWFLITNTPKVENITLTADTIGDLRIADIKDDGEGNEVPDTYGNEVDLQDKISINSYLSPVTTKDGLTFFSPVYNEGEVTDLSEVTDETKLHTKYVYEKTFFLRAGEEDVDANKAKNYDIFLVGYSTKENSGCYVTQKGNNITGDEITAANAVRISFTFEGGISGKAETVIYEPNVDKHNNGVEGTNMAFFSYNGADKEDYGTGKNGPATIQQYNNGRSFFPNSGNPARSNSLVTIKEGEDIKVTMRIWLEGTDEDCDNEIAADQIAGQIQFISEENLEQFEQETETKTTP